MCEHRGREGRFSQGLGDVLRVILSRSKERFLISSQFDFSSHIITLENCLILQQWEMSEVMVQKTQIAKTREDEDFFVFSSY